MKEGRSFREIKRLRERTGERRVEGWEDVLEVDKNVGDFGGEEGGEREKMGGGGGVCVTVLMLLAFLFNISFPSSVV